MEPIRFNFHLTYFFTSLQFFTQTWCETWVHVFKKSTSGQVIWSPHWLCKLSHYMYRGWHVLIAMHHFPSVAISQNYSVQCTLGKHKNIVQPPSHILHFGYVCITGEGCGLWSVCPPPCPIHDRAAYVIHSFCLANVAIIKGRRFHSSIKVR